EGPEPLADARAPARAHLPRRIVRPRRLQQTIPGDGRRVPALALRGDRAPPHRHRADPPASRAPALRLPDADESPDGVLRRLPAERRRGARFPHFARRVGAQARAGALLRRPQPRRVPQGRPPIPRSRPPLARLHKPRIRIRRRCDGGEPIPLAAYLIPGAELDAGVELARTADRLGYDSVWVTHGLGRDSFVVLAAYAAATTRVGPGNGVGPAFPRHPVA